MKKQKPQIVKLLMTGILIGIGLYLLKFLPMQKYGVDILTDASAHIAIAVLFLYLGYFFIDQNKNWRVPYFIFCFMVLTIISLQRIVSNNHNDIGLLLGLLVSVAAIYTANYKEMNRRIKF